MNVNRVANAFGRILPRAEIRTDLITILPLYEEEALNVNAMNSALRTNPAQFVIQ